MINVTEVTVLYYHVKTNIESRGESILFRYFQYLFLTFYSKGGSLGWLSQTTKGIELKVGRQGLDEADGHCAFTFTQWGGCYAVTRVICITLHMFLFVRCDNSM